MWKKPLAIFLVFAPFLFGALIVPELVDLAEFGDLNPETQPMIGKTIESAYMSGEKLILKFDDGSDTEVVVANARKPDFPLSSRLTFGIFFEAVAAVGALIFLIVIVLIFRGHMDDFNGKRQQILERRMPPGTM